MAQRRIVPTDSEDRTIVTREAQTAVAEGAVLEYHTDTLKVEELTTSSNLSVACGVALEAGAAGDQVKMVTRGVVDTLLDGTTDIAIGDSLQTEGTNAGVLKQIVPTITTVTTLRDTLVLTGPQVIPLAAQTANVATGTLTACKVNF